MKKFLLNLIKNNRGFSLVEILVAVTIIAILSVVSIAIYTNTQRDTRDTKRKSELDAISKALEINKSANGYEPVKPNQFNGGIFPGGETNQALDPQGYSYCIKSSATIVDIEDATTDGWIKNPASCPSGYNTISGSTPTAGDMAWKVCTLLENRGTTKTLCKSSSQ